MILALTLWAASALGADRLIVASKKIDTAEGALLGNVIAVLLESQGLGVENKIQLGPIGSSARRLWLDRSISTRKYTGNGALFFTIETDPGMEGCALGFDKVKALDLYEDQPGLAPTGPGEQYVDHRRAEGTGGRAVAQDLGGSGALYSERGEVQAGSFRRVRQSPAALPAFQSAYGFRLTQDQLLILSGGDTAATIRAAADARGERGDGLWHRRRAR